MVGRHGRWMRMILRMRCRVSWSRRRGRWRMMRSGGLARRRCTVRLARLIRSIICRCVGGSGVLWAWFIQRRLSLTLVVVLCISCCVVCTYLVLSIVKIYLLPTSRYIALHYNISTIDKN